MMDSIRQFAVSEVVFERKRQDELWGDQSERPLFERLSILVEEVGELAEAINETCLNSAIHPERGGVAAVQREATHVAAVAVSIIEAATRRETESQVNAKVRRGEAHE